MGGAGTAAAKSQSLLVESRHRIATSLNLIFNSRLTLTSRRPLRGSSDGVGLRTFHLCDHPLVRFEGHGGFEEMRRQRDAFAAEFGDRFVSSVDRSTAGVWGWSFCATCAAEQ
jgi:hypothetical protein